MSELSHKCIIPYMSGLSQKSPFTPPPKKIRHLLLRPLTIQLWYTQKTTKKKPIGIQTIESILSGVYASPSRVGERLISEVSAREP